MYAAAGGASLASRQARQRQRQQRHEQQQQQLTGKQKLKEPIGKTIQQYHNYTGDGTTVPLLSRVERGALKPPQHDRRHSASTSFRHHHQRHKLQKSTLKTTPPSRIHASPSITIPVAHHQHHHHHHRRRSTPTSPSGHQTVDDLLMLPQIEPLSYDQDDKNDSSGKQRRCSFVRQLEESRDNGQHHGLLDRCQHICNFEIKPDLFGPQQQYFGTTDPQIYGSIDYPFSECSQGRAAWQDRERARLGAGGADHRLKQTEAHHRWMKRNRIRDTAYGGAAGSDDDDQYVSGYQQNGPANILLYVGLGTTAIGSVIFFVGTGEKGFKTLELRLIGPTLIVCGLLCCFIRILFCVCPAPSCWRQYRIKQWQRARRKQQQRRRQKLVLPLQPAPQPPPPLTTLTGTGSPIGGGADTLLLPQICLPMTSDNDNGVTVPLLVTDDKNDNSTNNENRCYDSREFVTMLNEQTTKSPNTNNNNHNNNGRTTISNSNNNNNNNRTTTATHSGIVLSPLQLGQPVIHHETVIALDGGL